jgi:hypothetical protein
MAEIVWLPPIRDAAVRPISLMDVMQALVEWNKVEKPFYDRLHRQDAVSYSWFNDVISHWKLSSTFPRANRDTAGLQRKIASTLAKFKNDKNSIDYVTVLSYELEKFTTYGKDEKTRNPLAAASLIMWFFNREDVVIFTPKSKKALEYLIKDDAYYDQPETMALSADVELEEELRQEFLINGDEDMEVGVEFEIQFDLASYFDFHQCWVDIFLEYVADIQSICLNLLELCEYEDIPSACEYSCLTEEWFHRKVFAVWLDNLVERLPPDMR